MGSAWSGWAQATCMPEQCFCEHVGDGWIRQPSNVWSCLVFVAVGLAIIRRGMGDARRALPGREPAPNPLMAHSAYSWVFGVAVIFVGLFSGFFHASLSFIGQWTDVMSMYLVATFIVIYGLSRFYPVLQERFALAYLGVNLPLGAMLAVAPELRRYVFALLIAAGLGLELLAVRRLGLRRRNGYLGATVASFLAGVGIWTLDITKTVCAPESWLQGHAVWHGFSAAACAFLYAYYRSERAGEACEVRASAAPAGGAALPA